MSFLEYSGGERPDRFTPERVYAVLDEEASENGSVVFDAVEADWFDERRPRSPWLAQPEPDDLDWHVSVLQVRGEAAEHARHAAGEAEWFEVRLSTEPSDDVQHFVNLYAAPEPQRLLSVAPLPEDIEDELREAHSLDPLPDAATDDLESALGGAVAAEAAAVYDVGQGACNALLEGGTPTLYFDFGGGCLWNAGTYPAQLTDFCFTSDPLVVLSHWDHDHWAAANLDKRALSQPWIVPRHRGRLAPTHLSFLISLVAASSPVLVWPPTLPSITVGPLTIELGIGASRNDSGLALVWEEDGGPGRMLFPADAAYDYIPSAGTGDFTSLVVSHHGGQTHSTFVPPPDNSLHGRLVYSYGDGNTYGHPLAHDEHMHTVLWGAGIRTPALRGNLGHVHLYWSQTQAAATPACLSAKCQLDCCQR